MLNSSTEKFREMYFHGRALPPALLQCMSNAAIAAVLAEHGVRILDAEAKPDLLSGNYLTEADLANPDIASNAVATERLQAKIAWFCEDDNGNLFGYWLGESHEWPALPIIVRFDTEGQFKCEGAIGLGDVLAANGCGAEDDAYVALAEQCAAAGLEVTIKTLNGYYKVPNSIDPNAMRNADYYAERVKRGLSGAE